MFTIQKANEYYPEFTNGRVQKGDLVVNYDWYRGTDYRPKDGEQVIYEGQVYTVVASSPLLGVVSPDQLDVLLRPHQPQTDKE